MSQTPRVAAVSSKATHDMIKPNRDAIRIVAGFGVEGDAHNGKTIKHRFMVARDPSQPNLRQVHLIHGELHDELRTQGFDLVPGEMGENVTTRDLDVLKLPRGTRLRLGDTAVVEVTGLRGPCYQLDRLRPGLMKAVMFHGPDGKVVRKAGIMAIAIIDGVVRPGDGIEVELPPLPHEMLKPV